MIWLHKTRLQVFQPGHGRSWKCYTPLSILIQPHLSINTKPQRTKGCLWISMSYTKAVFTSKTEFPHFHPWNSAKSILFKNKVSVFSVRGLAKTSNNSVFAHGQNQSWPIRTHLLGQSANLHNYSYKHLSVYWIICLSIHLK